MDKLKLNKIENGHNWDLKTGQIEKRQIEQIETEQNWKMDKIEIWKQLDKSKKDIIGNRKLKIGQIKNEQNWELKTRQIEKKNKIENTDWQNWELDKIENGQTWKYRLTELFKNWTKLNMDRIGNLTKLS